MAAGKQPSLTASLPVLPTEGFSLLQGQHQPSPGPGSGSFKKRCGKRHKKKIITP